jgi:hypothetical protein
MLVSSCVTRPSFQGRNNFSSDYENYSQRNAGYQLFYDQLSPYGQWTRYQNYGYVWIPDAGRNFYPYLTEGRWVMTEFGWTWLSDYIWGWAPFHYGRWDYDSYYGWFWVPGYEWGPSWVIWRRANGYYGWTPMRPGMNINLSIIGTGGSRDVERWNFIRERDFTSPDIHRRVIDRRDNEMIFRNSTVINNTYVDNSRNETYVSGPPANEVQRSTSRRIQRIPVRDADRPGARINDTQLHIYRPRLEQSSSDQAVPPRVANPEEIRPASERGRVIQRRSQASEDQSSTGSQSPRKREERTVKQKEEKKKELTEPSVRRK